MAPVGGINWTDANEYCNDVYDTQLATIYNDYYAQSLLDLRTLYGVSDHYFWVGVNDHDTSGVWVYESGYNWYAFIVSFFFTNTNCIR